MLDCIVAAVIPAFIKKTYHNCNRGKKGKGHQGTYIKDPWTKPKRRSIESRGWRWVGQEKVVVGKWRQLYLNKNFLKIDIFCAAILLLKMEENMQHFCCIMLSYFKKGKNTTETKKKKICSVCGEGAMTD